MDLSNEPTRTNPRLIASCALGVLLAAASGCVGDSADHDPAEQLDALRGDGQSGPDAGVISYDAGDAPCVGEPPRPADAGSYDPGRPRPGYPPNASPCACQDAGSYDPVPTPVDAGAAPSCWGQVLGDGKSCISAADAKLRAEAVCAAEGLQLVDVKLDGAQCPGGSTQPWFSCCGKEPPPVASACIGAEIGDGITCLDWDSIKLRATAHCEASGMGLVEIAGSAPDDTDCAGGVVRAKYQCCHTWPRAGGEPPRPVKAVAEGWLQ